MADAVTSQKLVDGMKNLVMKFTNVSDGTGEAAVDKITPSALNAGRYGRPCTGIEIERIEYDCKTMSVDLLWDATADVLLASVGPGQGFLDFTRAPVPNNAGAGKTGKLQFTTTGHAVGARYTITIHARKKYG